MNLVVEAIGSSELAHSAAAILREVFEDEWKRRLESPTFQNPGQHLDLIARVESSGESVARIARANILEAGGNPMGEPAYFGIYFDLHPITEVIGKVTRVLKIRITSLDAGLKETYRWYLRHHRNGHMKVDFEDKLIVHGWCRSGAHGVLIARWAIFFLLLLLSVATFRVNDYGARGDGATIDTLAIQQAIDAAAKTGGTIVFRPGVYKSGASLLKSGTHLQIDEGVTIRGVQGLASYPSMPTRVAGIEMEWPAALLNVYEQSKVTISGKGIVDGDGEIWWDKYWKIRREEYEPKWIRDVEVYRLYGLSGVPHGILFKSASVRGGTIQDINIHDADMEGVGSVFSVQFNWNPSYSYSRIPDGIKDYPAYWKTLTEVVPPEKGLPHLRDVWISDIKAKDARAAFGIASYKDSPLLTFRFKNIDVAAKTAGSIQNASGWTFDNVHIATADGSTVRP